MNGEENQSLSIHREWSGHRGVLTCDEELIDEVCAFRIGGPKYARDETWHLNLDLENGDDPGVGARLRACSTSNLAFDGETDNGKAITVSDILLESGPAMEISGSSHEVQIDTVPLPEEPYQQTLVAVFSPSAVADRRFSFFRYELSGEIKEWSDEDREEEKPFLWENPIGEGSLERRYVYENVRVGGQKSVVRVPETVLELQVDETSLSQDPRELIDEAIRNVRWLARLLTFFSRQHVQCVEMAVHSEWGDEDDPRTRRVSRRLWARHTSSRPDYLSPLISGPGRMDADGLLSVKRTIEELPYREAIFNSIGFSVEGFRTKLVGAQLMNTFTSFETIVNAITKHEGTAFPLSKDSFALLRDKIKATVKGFFPGGGEDPKRVREALYRKIGTLKRVPFSMRAASLLRRRGIEWEDLWPGDVGLEEGISEPYERRSDIVHTGELPDDVNWFVDQFRIHALAERLIYAEVGADPDWISDSLAYNHCYGLTDEPA